MKIWKCSCGFRTSIVKSALDHTEKNEGHIMALKDVPDTTSYGVAVRGGID